MLSHYVITLKSNRELNTETSLSYPVYSSFLEQTSFELGEAAHSGSFQPLSQFVRTDSDRILWHVKLLGESAEESYGPLLENLKTLKLRKQDALLTVEERSVTKIPDVNELFALSEHAPAKQTIRFVTPTAFKQSGAYTILPSSRLVLQNLIKQWNACILECPIEDEDQQGMETMAAGLRISGFQLKDARFQMKNQKIPGFTGFITFQNTLQGFHGTLTNALLLFSDYSGIGIKTTLGMGGTCNMAYSTKRKDGKG